MKIQRFYQGVTWCFMPSNNIKGQLQPWPDKNKIPQIYHRDNDYIVNYTVRK